MDNPLARRFYFTVTNEARNLKVDEIAPKCQVKQNNYDEVCSGFDTPSKCYMKRWIGEVEIFVSTCKVCRYFVSDVLDEIFQFWDPKIISKGTEIHLGSQNWQDYISNRSLHPLFKWDMCSDGGVKKRVRCISSLLR